MASGHADYAPDLTFPLTPQQGGTGLGTLTLNGVVLGNGTNPATVTAAGAAYQVLQVPSSGGAPLFRALMFGTDSTLQVTNGPEFISAADANNLRVILLGRVPGDTQARLLIGIQGVIEWGSGSADQDLQINRSAANILAVQGVLAPATLNISQTSDIQPRVSLGGSGLIQLGGGGTVAPDVTISRSAAATLSMVGVGSPLVISIGQSTDAQARVAIGNGEIDFGPGGTVAPDVKIQRTAANVLAVLGVNTPGILNVASSGDAQPRVSIGGSGPAIQWGPGGITVPDITMSRAGAQALSITGIGAPITVSYGQSTDAFARIAFGGAGNAIQLGSGAAAADVQILRTGVAALRVVGLGTNNSTTGFEVVTTGAVQVLGVDTVNQQVKIAGVGIHGAATTGQILIADAANDALWTTPDGARVYNSVNIAVVTALALTFNSERWNSGGMHSTATNPSRLTAKKPGKYLIWADVEWDGTPTTTMLTLHIRVNGVTDVAITRQFGIATNQGTEMVISTLYNLNAGDYVEIVAEQNSGASLNVIADGNWSPEFAAQWLGP